MVRAKNARTWYDHARAYVEMKWPTAAAKTRFSIAEALATVTPVLVETKRNAPSPKLLRQAMIGWAFNPGSRGRVPPREIAEALRWISDMSMPVAAIREPAVVRRVLDACARTIDGRPAAATTVRRKRAVLYNALGELELLDANPIDKVQWKAPEVAVTVDRRVVANPEQVRALLSAVRRTGRRGEHMVAFFGCLYYAAIRPSEAIALRESSCELPDAGWGPPGPDRLGAAGRRRLDRQWELTGLSRPEASGAPGDPEHADSPGSRAAAP